MMWRSRREFLREAAGRWIVGGAAGLVLGAYRRAGAQDGTVVRPDDAVRISPATSRAIQQGLEYLSRVQNDDGSFGTGVYSRNVGVCSLAGLAFMAQGNTPRRGTFGRAVERCVGFILRCCQDSGFITYEGATSHGPMYEHGFATMFLAEVYGMSESPGLRTKLSAAVRLIVEKQNSEGGWRYQPERNEADISVTICQIMALRAARNAGLYVPNDTIDRCLEYVKRSQNPDGGFIYMLSSGGPSKFPRSAAGVVALYSAGIYEGTEIDRGLEYLLQFAPGKTPITAENHYLYGHYYAVQAMYQAGGNYWRRWYPPVAVELVGMQRKDGAWLDTTSPVYGTAMACLILQMPENHVQVFQK